MSPAALDLPAAPSPPKLLKGPASRPTPPVAQIPPLIDGPYPWFHHPQHDVHAGGGEQHDFASNASAAWAPQQPSIVITTTTDAHHIAKKGSGGGEERAVEGKNGLGVGPASLAPGAIRSGQALRSQRVYRRAFHPDSHLQLSPTSTSRLHNLPLELPPPTSPTRSRPRRFASWLAPLRAVLHGAPPPPPSVHLALYFTLNLALTLYNKSVLTHFPFPYTLSALHALCGALGTSALVRARGRGAPPPPRLKGRERGVLVLFSCLYTVNIVVSNVSLGLVTVPFHQVVRASTPLFTILFSACLFGVRSSRAKLVALVPVVAGVGFATYGDYYFTPWGFFLTLFGTVLAALKTIYTNLLQAPSSPSAYPYPYQNQIHAPSINSNPRVRAKILTKAPTPSPASASRRPHLPLPPLTPLHLLYLLSPLAFVETTLLAYFSGELGRVWAYTHPHTHSHLDGPGLSNGRLWLLLMNGLVAFALNVVSFSANRKVGALSMTVAANVKQVLTILCAVVMFNLTITPTNALGIGLTLVGGAVYAAVELGERERERARARGR